MTKSLSEITALTTAQRRRIKELEQAIRNAKRAGVGFHFILDTLYAYNGKVIENIVTMDDCNLESAAGSFTESDYVNVGELCSAMADDQHYVILRPRYAELLNPSDSD